MADAAAYILEIHARVLRMACTRLDQHCEGLAKIARVLAQRSTIDGTMKRTLLNIETAAAFVRHSTSAEERHALEQVGADAGTACRDLRRDRSCNCFCGSDRVCGTCSCGRHHATPGTTDSTSPVLSQVCARQSLRICRFFRCRTHSSRSLRQLLKLMKFRLVQAPKQREFGDCSRSPCEICGDR